MAKPSQKEITAADLTDYLDSESDFAFEIRAIKELQKAGDVLHVSCFSRNGTNRLLE